MAKSFIKSEENKTQLGPGFRTSDHFKGSIFSGGKSKFNAPNMKFNPSQFKTQHKGG